MESFELVGRAWPVLDEFRDSGFPYKPTEDERREDGVVGVPDDGHEVRHQVDGHGEVDD